MIFDHEFASRRSPVVGNGGMVASSQPLAVAAGLSILNLGGNAVDAAVATAAALCVTEPASIGLGGDCFALYYEASSQKVYSLNGTGRAPGSLTLERLLSEGFQDLPPYHPYTITVPGACAGWFDLVNRFGSLPMSGILSPAISLADEGFPVAPLTATFWSRYSRPTIHQTTNGSELLIQGRDPLPGEMFRNSGLARSLRLLGEEGKWAFYQGPIAEAITAAVKDAGGLLSMDDLANHTSTWEEPISTTYQGLRVWECPPNGQGLTTLLALNYLSAFDLSSMTALSPQRLHLEIECLRLAFADSRRYVADPAFQKIPLEDILSQSYADERRKLVNPKYANKDVPSGVLNTGNDTAYVSVVDKQGNACSFINSLYFGFGTGIVPRGWGFSLQNRGHNFSLRLGDFNVIAPRKRPYHTIIPCMVTSDNDSSLFASFGVVGGFMQPQGQLQVLLAMIHDDLGPQASLDQTRFCIDLASSRGDISNAYISIEEGIPVRTMSVLSEMGHLIKPTSGIDRSLFGIGQVIYREPKHQVLWGGSDPRGDGCAMSCL